MTNQLRVLRPYRAHGTWVFDDERVGLVQEPFVLGVPEMIDRLIEQAGLAGAEAGFRLLFSAAPFPGATPFRHVRDESGGAWYRDEEGREGWLCPAMLHYFDAPPPELYAKAEPAGPPAQDQTTP